MFVVQLTMRYHVDNVVCSCFFLALSVTFYSMITDWWSTVHPHPHVHRKPRWLLPCSSLWYGLRVIRRLQSDLHAATRLITSIRHCEHITQTLHNTIHLLLISQYITFKIVLFDCSGSRCPKYYGNVYTPVHTVAACLQLWSADHDDLIVAHVHITHFGCHSFHMWTVWTVEA